MPTFGMVISESTDFSIEFGTKQEQDCTIWKYYPRLYYVNEENKEFKFVKAKYMELQYSKGKCLIDANEHVLVFSDLSYLKLDDVHDHSSEVVELNTFKNLDQAYKPKGKSQYIIILNKDIDELVINQSKNSNFPNTNCKSVTINVSTSMKDKVFKNLCNFVLKIDKKTCIAIDISSRYKNTVDIGELLNLITDHKVTRLTIRGYLQTVLQRSVYTVLQFIMDNASLLEFEHIPDVMANRPRFELRGISEDNMHILEKYFNDQCKNYYIQDLTQGMTKNQLFINKVCIR